MLLKLISSKERNKSPTVLTAALHSPQNQLPPLIRTLLSSFSSSSKKWSFFLNYTAISYTITMNSLQLQRDSNGSDKLSDKTIVIPNKLTAIADSFKGEHSWYSCKIPFFFYGLDR